LTIEATGTDTINNHYKGVCISTGDVKKSHLEISSRNPIGSSRLALAVIKGDKRTDILNPESGRCSTNPRLMNGALDTTEVELPGW
jgi:hypothetical protein